MKLGPFDFRFIEIFHELYALENYSGGHMSGYYYQVHRSGIYNESRYRFLYQVIGPELYINSIESQLPDLIKKEEEKAYENIRKKQCEDDPIEWQQMQQQLYELIEDVLPRYFRNPIIVTLWAIFESAIIEIAKEVKDQKKLPISLSDINGDFLEKTNKYFNHILKISIDTRRSSWQHLRKFYLLRNAIAHGNGRLDNIKNTEDRNKIIQWENENIGITTMGGNLICSSDFIKRTYAVVSELLENMTERVQSKYPKPKNW